MIEADTAGHLSVRSTYWLLSGAETASIILIVPLWEFVYPIIDISVSGLLWNLTQASSLIILHVLYVPLLLRDARLNWRIVR